MKAKKNQMIIVSNNPDVRKNFNCCQYVNDSPEGVMRRVRDLVHLGHQLIGHPLAGQLRLQSNPHRSVALKKTVHGLDAASVMMVEETLERLRQVTFISVSEKDCADYRFIDLSLLKTLVADIGG
jgi:hypothetical protein